MNATKVGNVVFVLVVAVAVVVFMTYALTHPTEIGAVFGVVAAILVVSTPIWATVLTILYLRRRNRRNQT